MSKKHRGRFQAQGGGVEESESWSQDDPLSKHEGRSLLKRLVEKLTKKEHKDRINQIANAERFIDNSQGVDAPLKRSFVNKRKPGVRIDIEINAGTAFICISLLIIMIFLLIN